MFTEFFSSLDYELITKSLLSLLVFYVLVLLHAKKYLNIVNKIVMILFAFPLYYFLHRIVTEPSLMPGLLSQFFLFAIIHFFASLGGILANIENFQFASKNAFKLTVLILATYYMFNLVYIFFPWSDFSFGRAGFIIVPIVFVLIFIVSSIIIAVIVTSPKLHLQVFLMMIFIFIGLMLDDKYDYDIQEQIKQEQGEAKKKAEKLEEIRVKKANSKAEEVFKNLWNHEGSYSILEKKLRQVKNETKEIQIEKGAIALMLFLEDEQFKKLFEDNKPKDIDEMNHLGSILFKYYELENEKAYLKLFSILETYPHDYGEPLSKFFDYHYKLFSFEKFVNKNYDEVALIVLKYKNDIHSSRIKEYLSYAKQISNKEIRDKAIMFILNEIDVYGGRSLETLPITVINILEEENIDKYMKVLIKKVSNFPYDSMEYWTRYDDERGKNELVAMYNYLGEKHPLIKSFPKEMREFYFKNVSKNKKIKIIPTDNQKLRNTHWVESRCHTETRFDNNGNVHHSYFKESYHFALDNKIYISEDNYDDSECKLKQDNYTHQYYREYKEIETLGKSSDLYEIRLDAFYGDAKSFSDFKHKDAFFDLREDKLCFSKSIFTKKEQITESDNNGNLFTSHVRGFYIDDNKSDEIDYENCLI